MGYVLAYSNCLCCHKPFGFNPRFVPSSSAVTGTKEPICGPCIGIINEKRVANGMEPFIIHPEAYEPLPEEEL